MPMHDIMSVPNDDPDDVLVCEFERRPKGAPTVFDVAPAVRTVERAGATLTVTFDPAAAADVAAYVAAERQCCPTIRWELATEGEIRLTITGTRGQIATLDKLYRTAASGAV